MMNYEDPKFDIKTDARTHVFETESNTFYIFDASSILNAVDRGVAISLDGYGYDNGIIVTSNLNLYRGRNLNGDSTNIYKGEITYDPELLNINRNIFQESYINQLFKTTENTNTYIRNVYWSDAVAVYDSENNNSKRTLIQLAIREEENKVTIDNNSTLTSRIIPIETKIIAPKVGEIDPFYQLTKTVKNYGIALDALRLMSTRPSDKYHKFYHFITPDGVLFYRDGRYTLSGTQSDIFKERIKILSQTGELTDIDETDKPEIELDDIKNTEKEKKVNLTIEQTDDAIKFSDIGGLEDAKALLSRIAISFKHPEILAKWGAKRPNGVFFYGPPGTGKTTLAKALANEIDGELWQIKTSEIFDKWLGNSEKNLKNIFEKASNIKVPTVMLWDEFESIIPNTTSLDGGSTRAQNAIVGLFKQEAERLSEENPNIILMAASNDPDKIDESIIRAGRFDEKMYIPLPDEESRNAIWASKIAPLVNWDEQEFSRIASDIDFNYLAKVTEDWSGADITSCLQGLIFDKAMREASGEEVGPITNADLIEEIKQTNLNRIA